MVLTAAINNFMYTIRPLETEDDFIQLKSLFSDYLIDQSIVPTENIFESFLNPYKNENKFVGAFTDSKLEAVIRYCHWTHVPYSFINSIIYNNVEPLSQIFEYIIAMFESQQRYNWIYARPVFLGTDMTMLKDRYDWYIDEVILVGDRSKYPAYDAINFFREVKLDTNIIIFTLKPEYRHDGDVISEEFKHYE